MPTRRLFRFSIVKLHAPHITIHKHNHLHLATMAAAEAVLNTTELLEMILSELTVIELWKVRRVSPRWLDVVTGSATLQERMVLKPLQMTHPWHASRSGNSYWNSRLINYPIQQEIRISGPLSKYNIPDSDGPFNHTLCPVTNMYTMTRLEILQLHKFRDDLDRFAVFPPVQALYLELMENSGRRLKECTILVRDGVRIGDVVDAAKAMLATEYRYCPELGLEENQVRVGMEQLVPGPRKFDMSPGLL